MGHSGGFRGGLQNLIQVAQHRHLPVVARIGRVFQRGVVMGNAFGVVGADQGLIQKLPFLVAHIGNEQAEENVQLLDLRRQFRELDTGAVQHFIDRPIHLADLHDIDTMRACWGNLDKFSAHIGTGPVELVPF